MTLSGQALQLLWAAFGPGSHSTVAVKDLTTVLEIQQWVKAQADSARAQEIPRAE